VERAQEREALAAMGIPLAQGFALARPRRELEAGLRLPAAPPAGQGVHALVQRESTVVTPAHVPQAVANPGALPGSGAALVSDDDGRPVGLLVRGVDGAWRLKRDLLCAEPDEPAAPVARRGMARAPEDRFDPIVCVDETGRHIGLIAMDDLVQELIRAAD
jgi:hypothetical protein